MEKKTAFKDLSRKAKVQYIWDYYRWHIIVAVCVIGFIISLIVHYVTDKESVLDILMVSTITPYSDNTTSTNEFFEQEGFSDKEQEISIDTSVLVSDNAEHTVDYANDENISLKLAFGGTDIFFAPEFIFERYANQGCIMPLTEYLSEEEIAQYDDILVYATDSETHETVPCGVQLTNNKWLSSNGYYTGTVYFGVVYATDAKDTAVDFFHYVMNYNQ